MQRYIFLDLDDTLFQTLRKCPQDREDPRLAVRAFLPDGTPNSYATHKQQWLWQWLSQDFKLVPVTARDFHAFERVTLNFDQEIILNHGAVVLTKERRLDALWMTTILANLPNYHRKLLDVWRLLSAHTERLEGYKLRLVQDFGVTWYGVIKHCDGSEAPLKLLVDEILQEHPLMIDQELYWHLNSNNLAILPKIITKESAVSYLMTKYLAQDPELLTIGAGDSKTDAAFISLCDYALIPSNTQLFKTLNFS